MYNATTPQTVEIIKSDHRLVLEPKNIQNEKKLFFFEIVKISMSLCYP